MAQAGYTPIQLYYSTTASAAPTNTNLVNGELAINITDGKLYYKDNGGTVQTLATKGTAAIGGSTTQIQFNSSGALNGSSNLTWDGSNVQIGSQGDLRFGDSDNSNWVAFQGPATVASNVTWTLPSTDGSNGQLLSTNGTGTLSWATGAVGDVTAAGNNAFTGANTFYNGTGQVIGTGTSTQDGFKITGRAGGSSSYRLTLTPDTLSASRTVTFPDGGGNYTVGYRNLPAVGTKTGSYTLAVGDVGKYVQVSTGGSITIPDATFAEGDAISIFNNTSAGITITCSITTAYIAGTDSDKATMTLATRGVATVLFISSTVCVVSGNVT